MHKIDDHWYVYFSASVCAPDQWDVMLPTLRVYVLQGGKENPLSSDYKILDAIVPPNYNAGMLDAVCYSMAFITSVWLIRPCRQSLTLRASITFWYVFPYA
jgi:GH43 family beta-xylosidase